MPLTRIYLAFAISFFLTGMVNPSQPPSRPGTGLPGCPSDDAATQANCTLAQDMLDVYNENVQTDTSLPPLLGGPHGTHVQCDRDYHQRMHDLSVMYENAVAALKKKGDPFPQRDAIAGFRNEIIGVSNAWIRCMQQPLHTIATPSTKNPAGG